MLFRILARDTIPSYVKMSYAILGYVILISLLRYCGDVVIQPRLNEQVVVKEMKEFKPSSQVFFLLQVKVSLIRYCNRCCTLCDCYQCLKHSTDLG